ncbi:MAG: H/ACA ribonucleoprotein complex subunit GAR1 [Candidatus Hodarchaeota archaeon]
MRRLGKVLHVSKQGSLILRTDKTPPMGDRSIVVDKSAEKIGTIVDVFGPVKNPYVAVRPLEKKRLDRLVGQILYLYRPKRR